MRTFDFDAPVGHSDAVAAIEAALSDEGLVLDTGSNCPSRITSVRMVVGDRFIDRYHVPGWRICDPDEWRARSEGPAH